MLPGRKVLFLKQQQERESIHIGNEISIELQLSGRGRTLRPLEIVCSHTCVHEGIVSSREKVPECSGNCRQATQGLAKISEVYATVYSMNEYQEVINSSVGVR